MAVEVKYVNGMRLAPYLRRYWYFPRLTGLLFEEIGPSMRSRGYLTYEDLALIYVWKALLWQLRKGGCFQPLQVESTKIREKTELIFRTDHSNQHAVASLLEALASMVEPHQVGLRVATAALSVAFPELYGVVDSHVLSALGIGTDDIDGFVRAIFKMREIAEEQNQLNAETSWTPRKVDKALWVLDQQESEG